MELWLECAPWFWWVLGGILIAIELTAPTSFFLSIGISAFLVAITQWVTGKIFEPQTGLLLFAALSTLSLVFWWKFIRCKSWHAKKGNVFLNEKGQELVGKTFTIENSIPKNGSGSIKIKGVIWRVEGAEASAGDVVKVEAISGNTLTVSSLK